MLENVVNVKHTLCYDTLSDVHGPNKWPLESLKIFFVAPHHFYLSTPGLEGHKAPGGTSYG